MENAIVVNGITKDYGNKRGIFDFKFEIPKGRVYGLVGTNGSGKTTTIRALMGFVKPNNGTCSIDGYDCWTDASIIKKYVSYVPGDINFPDVGTGSDFLKLQADYYGIKDYSEMNRLIDLFKLDVSVSLRRMSKGMKQKTALIACFMTNRDIILLDEPSTGLDPLMRDALIDLINREKAKGKTILMSSHIFKELEDTCDAVIFIHNGKVIKVSSRDEFSYHDLKKIRISFNVPEEMRAFIKSKKYNTINVNTNESSLIVLCSDGDINNLFTSISNYDIASFDCLNHSLELYYDDVIKKEEC